MDGHEFSKMDKNKSAFKLKGLPAIYWLNLDADENRRFYMEEQFKYWEITNHTRISGYDAREDDVSGYLKGRIPDNVSQPELGCCMSHLKAIKHFYEETDDEYCMILEDDVDFSTVRYWNSTTRQLNLAQLTGDFNIYDEFVGEESGARHKALPSSIIDKYNIPDPFVDNSNFQIQADDILDFSETNPFGRP